VSNVESLSIIILNHNTYQVTCDCLKSVYQSNLKEIDLQIILIDNGSTEICPVPISEIFKDIIYIKSDENLGFARGNNLGLQYANKDYILLLNSDTVIVDPDTFHKTISVLKRFDDGIVLTTQLLTSDGKPQVAYGPIPGLSNEFILTTFLYKCFSEEKLADHLITFTPHQNRLIDCGYITATYLLFSRRALDVLPGRKLYDRTFMYGEELFWATDWLARGIKLYYCADVSIIHLIGQSSKRKKSYSKTRRRFQLHAELHFMRFRYSTLVVFLICFLRICRFLVLSPFDKDIRLRLALLPEVIFTRKHINNATS
jgi:GT2 family glycosyltransferase